MRSQVAAEAAAAASFGLATEFTEWQQTVSFPRHLAEMVGGARYRVAQYQQFQVKINQMRGHMQQDMKHKLVLWICTQLQCVADKKGKLIEEGLAPALPPWPGVYLGTPVTTMDSIL